jgi:hypothetical protein
MSKYWKFDEDFKAGAVHEVPQAVACRALGVSQSWFSTWRHGDASPRHAPAASS